MNISHKKLTIVSVTALVLSLGSLGRANDDLRNNQAQASQQSRGSDSQSAPSAAQANSYVTPITTPTADKGRRSDAASQQSERAATTSSAETETQEAQQADRSTIAVSTTESTSAAQHSAIAPGSASAHGSTHESAATTAAAVYVASQDDEKFTDRKLAGRSVRGSDGKSLGNVKDFLIETSSGHVAYGVVSSGGFAGIGDKLRLVPFDALKGSADQDEFNLSIDKTQWDDLPSMKDDELDQGAIAMADSDRRRIAAPFAGDTITEPATTWASAAMSSHLIRASDLRGRDLHSGSREIGVIEGLVIDTVAGTASALVDVQKSFVQSDHKFLVPLGRLALGESKRDEVTTMLTSADFQPQQTEVSAPNVSARDAATTEARVSSGQSGSTTSTVAANDPATEGTPSVSSRTAASDPQNTPTTPGKDELAPTGRASADPTGNVASTDYSIQAKSDEPSAPEQSAKTQIASSSPSRASLSADTEKTASSQPSVTANDSTAASSKQESADTTPSATKSRTDEQVASTVQTKSDGPELSPTGKTSAEQSPSIDPDLMSTARAIRESLDGDDSLRAADIEVKPENGRIVLRGTVKDEALKNSMEKKARAAAADHDIDFQVTVGTP